MNYSLNNVYKTVGISKQAVDQYAKRQKVFDRQIEQLISHADILKDEHPGCGVEKMYHTLKPNFIGRDRFVETFMDLGYRVKRHKNYRKTTRSSKMYYPNLIKGLTIDGPSQVWQSDITYIRVGPRFYYAIFIIDVYTKKIVGYQLSNHMRSSANVKALKMALKENDPPTIHHSDRGSQYISNEYTGILKDKGCRISMAGTALDNAYAERINKTIKEEYLKYWDIKEFDQLQKAIKKAVINYNTKRKHNNLKRQSPMEFETNWVSMDKKERPLITIYNYQESN